jgi:hypothetical protein
MQKHNISASDALSHVRQARSIVEPNEGFMKQLELYGEMQMPDNVEETPAYQRWVYQREIELSRACGQAPEAEKIRFEDEHHSTQDSDFELRCRKCRYVGSTYIIAQVLMLLHSLLFELGRLHAAADTVTDGRLQRRSISFLMIPPLTALLRQGIPTAPHRDALTISWIHCLGCVLSLSKANWTGDLSVRSAIQMWGNTPGKGCSAAAANGSYRE